MDPEEIVDRLVAAGVFEPVGDELRLGDAFRSDVETLTETLAEGGARERIDAVGTDPSVREELLAAADGDPQFLASYLALAERLADLSHRRRLRVAVVADGLSAEPRSDGAPDRFLPVDGEKLGTVASLYDRCLVYVWREDCPPCETVRADLEAIFADGPPDDLVLLSVYGPAAAETLSEEFGVVGGPTALFLLNGAVDARLRGENHREVLEREIETLRGRTLDPA